MKTLLHVFALSLTLFSTVLMADNNAVIAIDIGHTLKNHGSTSARGVGEFHFNQTIAKQLQATLIDQGYTQTLLINPEGKDIGLKERTQFALDHKADVFISIHHDSMQLQFLKKWNYKGKEYLHGEKFKGYSLFISQQTEHKANNLQLANAIGDSMLNSEFTPTLHHAMPIKGENRKLLDKEKGIYEFPELAVLRTAKMPAILVECGIIVNKEEELLLSSKDYQVKITAAIAKGIRVYLGEKS